MTSDAPRESTGTSVGRVVEIIRQLCEDPEAGLSVRSAAAKTGISKSAVQRILAKLADEDVAILRADGSYAVGPAMLGWAARLLRGSSLLEVADRVMRRLAGEVEETICFAQLMPAEQQMIFVHVVEIDRPVKYVVPIGSRAPFHAGAVGKAVLAWLSPSVIDDLPMEVYTPDTPQDRAALIAELEEIRSQGYAISFGERYAGAVGIACAVIINGEPVGAMSISVPRPRLDPDKVEYLSLKVREAAREMAEMLPALAVPVSTRSEM